MLAGFYKKILFKQSKNHHQQVFPAQCFQLLAPSQSAHVLLQVWFHPQKHPAPGPGCPLKNLEEAQVPAGPPGRLYPLRRDTNEGFKEVLLELKTKVL